MTLVVSDDAADDPRCFDFPLLGKLIIDQVAWFDETHRVYEIFNATIGIGKV